MQIYSLDDVRKHDKDKDAWIVIEGFVHDITEYLHEHPGGKDIIIPHLGTDATEVFTSEKEHAHSQTAFSILARYRIGVLDSAKDIVDRTIETEKLRSLVDVSKPILPQIPGLGKDYSPWLHSQFGLKEIIIFDNILEKFSRYPWWYIFFMWTPVIILCFSKSFANVGFFHTMFKFSLGCLFWSVIEYSLHRFIFHMHTETPKWNVFHFFAHGIHHLTPNDPDRLTFPPLFSALLGLSVYHSTTTFVSHSWGIHGFLAGISTGFMLYDAIHYYFHHGEAPWLPGFLKRMKTAHLNHHYKDDHAGFGVTSQLFDIICGTLPKEKEN